MVTSDQPMPERRSLRRDAEENRQRVLAAAVTAILREGSGVSMTKIADEAGVGVGTLYRRYPSREHLLEALQLRSYQLVIAMVQEVESRDLRGIDAVRMFLDRTVAHGTELVMTWHGAPPPQLQETQRLEGELHGRVSSLIERAVRDGSVRPDLETRDLLLFGALVAEPLPSTTDWQASMGRQIDFFIDGIRA